MPPGLGIWIHDSRLGASLAKPTTAGATNWTFPMGLRGIHTPRTFDLLQGPSAHGANSRFVIRSNLSTGARPCFQFPLFIFQRQTITIHALPPKQRDG